MNAGKAAVAAPLESAEILIERARSLVPALRSRAKEANAERRLPQATIDDFRRLGLTRCLQPAMFGGYGSDYRVFSRMIRALAQGCGSSAWVAAVHTEHLGGLFSQAGGMFTDNAQAQGHIQSLPRVDRFALSARIIW